MSVRHDICQILGIPTHILIDIILKLNARDRLALGATCTTLCSLVFEEKPLLRDLDFSEDGFLTASADVEKYFQDKTMLEYILKLNLSSIYCPKPQNLLRSISKATNLIEINITGCKFETFQEFGEFLEPLTQLKKLSSDWPSRKQGEIQYQECLAEPFSRLTHLSLTIYEPADKWSLLYSLKMCRELEELRLIMTYKQPECKRRRFWMETLDQLDKLRLVVCYGIEAGVFETIVVTNLLPDPDQWARNYPYSESQLPYFYFEKDLEVSEVFTDKVPIKLDSFNHNMRGWYLCQQRLLEEVVDQKIGPKKYCCLSGHPRKTFYSITVKDAKLLLENPQHQITYLSLPHNIEPHCDVHLIAQIFPKLTRLVLNNLSEYKDSILQQELLFKTGKKRKRTVSEGRSEAVRRNQNSSFKKLVDNTPSLEDFTLYARSRLQENEIPDLDALYSIGGWKNLKTLWLANVPITDGDFLVEIAKQCKNLEKLRIEHLGPRNICCYKEGLVKMLQLCNNLKDFSIQQNNIAKIFEIFEVLADLPKLRRVSIESLGRERSVRNLIPAVEKLIRSCDLILLICEIKGLTEIISGDLEATLKRLKDELKRPNFHYQVLWRNGAEKSTRNFALDFAHRDLTLPQQFTDVMYRLNLSE